MSSCAECMYEYNTKTAPAMVRYKFVACVVIERGRERSIIHSKHAQDDAAALYPKTL